MFMDVSAYIFRVVSASTSRVPITTPSVVAGLDRREDVLDAGARTIFGGLGEDFARGLVRESPGGAEVRHARLGGGDGVRRAVAQAFRGVQDQAFGLLEPDAGVRDGDARIGRHAGHQVLLAGQQTAFEHQARDAVVSGELLRQDILEDNVLAGGVAARIAVAAVDRERTRDAGVFELAERCVDARGIVVFAGDAPAQDQVAVRIALAADDAADAPAVLVLEICAVAPAEGLHREGIFTALQVFVFNIP